MKYFEKLYTDTELPQRARLLYYYLHARMDKDRICWPGIKRIGQDLSMSRSTVKRALKDLERSGYIRIEEAYRENGSFTSNRYHLL